MLYLGSWLVFCPSFVWKWENNVGVCIAFSCSQILLSLKMGIRPLRFLALISLAWNRHLKNSSGDSLTGCCYFHICVLSKCDGSICSAIFLCYIMVRWYYTTFLLNNIFSPFSCGLLPTIKLRWWRFGRVQHNWNHSTFKVLIWNVGEKGLLNNLKHKLGCGGSYSPSEASPNVKLSNEIA